MHVLVIDDEPLAADNLAAKIRRIDPSLFVETVTNPIAALEIFRKNAPDIVFLDITMPELSGFELLSQLEDAEQRFALVFCTAHAEFALEAFEAAALDYLVKPASPERVEKALQKAVAAVRGEWPKRLEESSFAAPLRKIAVKDNNTVFWVQDTDIAYLQSEAHETVLYTQNGEEHFCGLSLNALGTRLDSTLFFRCHRGTVVNLQAVLEVDLDANTVTVKSGANALKTLPVSRRAKSALKARIQLR